MMSSNLMAVLDGATWKKNGKSEFMKKISSLLPPDQNHSLTDKKMKEINRLIYSLLSSAINGNLDLDSTSDTISELVNCEKILSSTIVDIMCVIDMATAAVTDNVDNRKRFFLLIQKVCGNSIPIEFFKERMEIDSLEESGILQNAKKFFTTFIKLKTKLFYKQQKFNLLREECEGYSKLITELNRSDISQVVPSEMLQIMKSIIGYFNLDPNRVLDIILESFECHLQRHKFYIGLLREYTPDVKTIQELISFKIKNCSDSESSQHVLPDSLLRLSALMIQKNMIHLSSIYDILEPESDAIMFSEAEEEMKNALESIRRLGVVSTASVSEADANKGALTVSPVDATTSSAAVGTLNQKLSLLRAFIDVGAWTEAESIISTLPPYYAVSHVGISKSLCHLIHVTMDPLYRKCNHLCSRYDSSSQRFKGFPGISTIENFEEFISVLLPMLLVLGPFAHQDPILIFKLCRIIKTSLNIFDVLSDRERKLGTLINPNETQLYFETLTLLDEVLLPSLSLLDSNCCVSDEIWSILHAFPYHFRYRLYNEWKTESYSLHPKLMMKKVEVMKDIKRIMQRLSKNNVKQIARHLAKLTHSSPGLVFEYILSQIQLYDNLVSPVVDSLKYVTSMSLDILGYHIIEALSNPEKDRTKHDATSISVWLQSLSVFCGLAYKKYNIDLGGILQYVANQLKSKRSLDLLILKEIVHKMGGIETYEEMTDEQLEAISGGDLLKIEAGSFNHVKNTKKSSQRLKEALIEYNLAVPLGILMAQQRNCVVYEETENSHLKLVGKLLDQCQDTLVQFGYFLATHMSIDDYSRRLPPMGQLLSRFHINCDLAFFLTRPMYNHQISLKFEELCQSNTSEALTSDVDLLTQIHVKASLTVMAPVIEAVIPLHPPKIWDDLSPQFLTTFWSLTMFDLSVPELIYEKEITKLSEIAPAKVDESKDLTTVRKKREKERLQLLTEKLKEEERKQKEHVTRIMARLQHEKDSWFVSNQLSSPRGPSKVGKNETITTFLQLCLFPRCIFTATDASFCAKFVEIVHMLKTPNFATLICLDRIFCDITYTVTACSENEARRYGRFLCAMFDIVMRWHSSKEIYQQECIGFPGFVTKFRVVKEGLAAANDSSDHVDYENYRHVCHKWHFKVAKALVVCLESKDYVQIRNALTVLIKIIPHFPVITTLASVIEKRVDRVCVDEKLTRKDLYIMATSYAGLLKTRKSNMIAENKFHQVRAPASVNGVNGVTTVDDDSTKTAARCRVRENSNRKTTKQTDSNTLSAAIDTSSSLMEGTNTESDRDEKRRRKSDASTTNTTGKHDDESLNRTSHRDRSSDKDLANGTCSVDGSKEKKVDKKRERSKEVVGSDTNENESGKRRRSLSPVGQQRSFRTNQSQSRSQKIRK